MGSNFSKNEKLKCYHGRSSYGALPLEFIRGKLDDEVLHYLQQDDFFQADEGRIESLGYAKAVDHPSIKNHFYYEGYYHSIPSPAPFYSMNARYGYDFDKPAAPLRLTAFLETLRRVNAEWTAHLVDELSKLSSSNPAAVALIDLLKDNRHFGDISSQIHYGDEVPPHMAAFHNDGPNSSIHLALSISGRRSLYWKGSKDPSFLEDVHSSKPSGYKTLEEKQGPGSVYLSSPFIVSHGVAYKESTWKDRIIALQCRCLFTRAEYDEMYKASEFEWRVTMETVTSCMGRLGEIDGSTIFRLPQLPHVKKVYAELYPQWQRYNEELIQTKTSATSGSQPAISLVTFMKQNPREGLPDKDNEPSEE